MGSSLQCGTEGGAQLPRYNEGPLYCLVNVYIMDTIEFAQMNGQ